MTDGISITATCCNGKPLAVLGELIKERERVLKETSSESVIATTINVLSSLRGLTRTAPLRGNRKMYTLEETSLAAGWERKGKTFHRVVRCGLHGPVDRNVTRRCRNLVGPHYLPGESVKVFKAQLFNENLNETVYYALARSRGEVEKYLNDVILARLLKKESGMAKYAISVAQAKASNRPMTSQASGSRQWRLAYEAAQVESAREGFSSGNFWMSFVDYLRYSALALRGGTAAVNVALMKAANRTYGILKNYFHNHPDIEDRSAAVCPFPEVQGRR